MERPGLKTLKPPSKVTVREKPRFTHETASVNHLVRVWRDSAHNDPRGQYFVREGAALAHGMAGRTFSDAVKR